MSMHLQQTARPYAHGAFEWAVAAKSEAKWQHLLSSLASVFEQSSVQQALLDPRCGQQALATVVLQALPTEMDDAQKNFLRLLAEQRRLNILPAIAMIFDALVAKAQQQLKVELTSAYPLSESELQRIRDKLTQKYQKQIHLECSLDQALLGGLFFRIGDEVIDASVRGKLKQLAQQLMQ
jgi:F-type H+-transporting ATPase subunit delta